MAKNNLKQSIEYEVVLYSEVTERWSEGSVRAKNLEEAEKKAQKKYSRYLIMDVHEKF